MCSFMWCNEFCMRERGEREREREGKEIYWLYQENQESNPQTLHIADCRLPNQLIVVSIKCQSLNLITSQGNTLKATIDSQKFLVN